MDPGAFTLRQLVWMAKARDEQLWNHTAALGSWIASAFTGKEVNVEDLHPYVRMRAKYAEAIDVIPWKTFVGALKQAEGREKK